MAKVIQLSDLDRLEKNGIGGFTTYDEQMALIALARKAVQQRDRYVPVAIWNKKHNRWDELEDTSHD